MLLRLWIFLMNDECFVVSALDSVIGNARLKTYVIDPLEADLTSLVKGDNDTIVNCVN